MAYFPIYLDMQQRPCLVVGGGAVAERKIASLLEAGANVTVVSPDITDNIARWWKQGSIHLQARRYRAGDTVGYRIVFAATDDADLNDVVFRECRNSGVWINAADDPGRCDFILPSVLRRGDLAIAISTGGESPALARTIREELEFYFTGEYDSLVKLASEVRSELRAKGISLPFENWQRALTGDVRQLLMRGDLARAREVFLKDLEASL
jgi:precorrin-2 dehydrogenase/sirohydrochlorin ferrochelatase